MISQARSGEIKNTAQQEGDDDALDDDAKGGLGALVHAAISHEGLIGSGLVQNYLVMLDERARARQQQELLREINSRIAGIDWTSAENDTVDFHCECGASDCVGTVSLTPNEYTSLRQKGLVSREGHETQPVLDQGPTISYAHAERTPRGKPTPLPES